MALAKKAVTLKGSRHEVVWSFERTASGELMVEGAPFAGWVPRTACARIHSDVDVITVQALGDDALAAVRGMLGDSSRDLLADLHAARACILGVNGSQRARDVRAWISAVSRAVPLALTALRYYLLSLSEGGDPAEMSELIRELVGEADDEGDEEDAPEETFRGE